MTADIQATWDSLWATYSLLYRPGDVFELRALEVPRRGTVSGYFNDFIPMATAAISLSGVANTYLTLNPVNPDLIHRSYNHLTSYARYTTADADITMRRCILVDFDSTRPSGISATEEEHVLAIERATNAREQLLRDFSIGSALCDSGNGAHILIPVELPNDNDSRDLVTEVLVAIGTWYDDERVTVDRRTFNSARITRAYGTMCQKGDDTLERPHRMSRILDWVNTANLVSVDHLRRVAATSPTRNTPNRRTNDRNSFDMVGFLTRHPEELRVVNVAEYRGGQRWRIERCPFNPDHLAPGVALFLADGQPGFRCMHNSCSENHIGELLRFFGEGIIPTATLLDITTLEEFSSPQVQQQAPIPQTPLPPHGIRIEEGPFLGGSDATNAEQLVQSFGGVLRHCHSMKKWLIWDGMRWAPDDTEQIMQYPILIAQASANQAANIDNDDDRRRATADARAAMNERSIKACLALARSRLAVNEIDLNSDPWALNILSGILDLRTGTISSHDASRFMTKLAPVTWDGSPVESPAWKQHINFFLPDPAVQSYLQRALGYALTGVGDERAMFIMNGEGANGKSIICEVFARMLGDYAISTEAETVLAKRTGAATNDLARLRGARFVHASETDRSAQLAEARVKELTGGDTVTARFLFNEFFDFRPQCKIFVRTNNKPIVRGTDPAIWARLQVIPFDVVIPHEHKRPHNEVEAELMNELPGILAWACAGCFAWQKQRLSPPKRIREANVEYRHSMDVIGHFLEETFVIDPLQRIQASLVSAAYARWCRLNSEYAYNTRMFGEMLRSRGVYTSIGAHGVRFWHGFRFNDRMATELGLSPNIISQIEELR